MSNFADLFNKNIEVPRDSASTKTPPVPYDEFTDGVKEVSNDSFYDVDTSDLNDEKIELFKKMESTNETMYITGRAGSGKSYLLEFFVKNSKKKVVVVAPTGVAAMNVGGQTIHSLFALPPADVQDLDKIRHDGVYGKRKLVLQEMDVLVIDEVSMVSADLIDAIDLKLRLANESALPFGGKQVIMFGDLYQLPPVIRSAQVRRYFEDTYGSIFFFASPVFEKQPFGFYELETVFRQPDQDFVKILNDIRIGQPSNEDLATLNDRYGLLEYQSAHKRFVTLTPRNDTAARINQQMLDKIPRQEYTYTATTSGNINLKSCPTEPVLKLKVGAQVMMLVNDGSDGAYSHAPNHGRRWANGTLGIISELQPNSIKVMIDGVEYAIERHTWERNEYEYDAIKKELVARPSATFTQFPVRLAWAITIHKAQGQTYQSIAVDLGDGAFAAGQTYVALSRCVSLDNLYLYTPIRRQDIIVDQEVVNFMDNHGSSDSSEVAEIDISDLPF